MRISRQTKHTLTLILGTAIGFLMVTLLFINIAMPSTQSAPQAAAGGIEGEQAQTPMAAEQPEPAQSEPAQLEPAQLEPAQLEPAQDIVAAPVAPVVTEETPPEELEPSPIPAPEAGTSKGWFSANTKLTAFFVIAAIGVVLFCFIIFMTHIIHTDTAALSEAEA